ncbi:MAG: GNAT family N-acetyltransferase [Firmicutes bacterium]|mgnify:CR=1 FL=1|jgi:GNAT superfamily N-acetyltransferase|nr:GNAT family N-acetyltransferase [Bacillota bacterium]
MHIRPYEPQYLDEVLSLSLRAWEPVFRSIGEVMPAQIYSEIYPDWRRVQAKSVQDVCTSDEMKVWVALNSGRVVGFVAVTLYPEAEMGEIYMLAVEPELQQQGIGSALTECALQWITDAGMSIAMVETGGDPGHAPARKTYEKAGFSPFPIIRYFKRL